MSEQAPPFVVVYRGKNGTIDRPLPCDSEELARLRAIAIEERQRNKGWEWSGKIGVYQLVEEKNRAIVQEVGGDQATTGREPKRDERGRFVRTDI